jgi:hypothetical protein
MTTSRKIGACMIVIERNGRLTVISGWRAWVIGAVAVAVTTIALFFAASVSTSLAGIGVSGGSGYSRSWVLI